MSQTGDSEKARELINILVRRGRNFFEVFMGVLKENRYTHLTTLLRRTLEEEDVDTPQTGKRY